MRALELTGRIDEKGFIRIDKPLRVVNKRIKIIILMQEDGDLSDEDWLYAASSNPAFDFLNEEAENIYALPDEKLLANVTREIKRLPEHLLPDVQKMIAGLLALKQSKPEKRKELTYEERLKVIMDAGKYLTEKEDFEQYMKDFEKSTQDRPLPFREP